MIDIFQPLHYKIPEPVPGEITTILTYGIEKYAVSTLPCSDYMRAAEGFFRFRRHSLATEHTDYVNARTVEIYGVVKTLEPDSVLILVDYELRSNLKVGVYIRKDLNVMIGCIRGYRVDKMTEEQYNRLWFGAPKRSAPNARER